ncbi:dTDP-4-dehydrorhamnose 3,5-epimerase family protein [Actinocorallia populi]|uniref:dTDP-4-dehydrorhamnose 3,5-epimerase family protein n=1 Tax=Actinocorallia populi TaxID=2079200 RepID=UPI000D093219|nr:dTDP-4-dehydrorhamnose 3,5-epimerase family protein [Actinocorallia populi]
MRAHELTVEGAYAFAAGSFPDDRGVFLSPYQEAAFTEAVGHALFPVAQCSYSRSRRGVVRGVHFTATPPGMAKYAFCSRGRALDVVVDTRTGSPTFGRWDAVTLGQDGFTSVYLPVGVGHLFVSLEDDTTMAYLLSTAYVAEYEHALNPLDPELRLPIPEGMEPILSPRDREGLTLAQARERHLLPDYATCREADAAWGAVAHRRPAAR